MDHRERAWRAIHHQQPDRPPIDYMARPEVTQAMLRALGLDTIDSLLEHLAVDFRYIEPREVIYERQRYVGPPLRTFADGSWEDIWGVRRVRVTVDGGSYDDVSHSPLSHATTLEDVHAHRWPKPDWFDYSDVADQCRRYEPYTLVGGGWGAIFGDAYRLQGLEVFLGNLVELPEIIQAIIDHVEDFYRGVNERIFDAANGRLDIYYFGNDFGTQRAPMISPAMYRRFFGPGIARLAGQAKERGMAVMFHSCGAVRPLIRDFISAGIDILDPVQAKADGMDPPSLKEEFGHQICLHGGVDTQRLLPFGTPDEVKVQVRELVEIVGSGGGYILAPDQVLQGDIPVANVRALYSALD